jgi:O-antigen ligase
MTTLTADAGALLIALGVFLFGVRRLRAGRELSLVLLIVTLLLGESFVYSDPNLVPLSVVHPAFGGANVRLMDLVAFAGLFAVIRVRGLPRYFSTAALLWILTGVWYVTAAIFGHTAHDSSTLMLFQVKTVLHICALYAVAAVVPREQWLSRQMRRYLYGVSIITTVMMALSQAHVRFTLTIPALPLDAFGSLGSDAATVLAALGMIALALACTAQQQRVLLLVAAGPLFVCTVAADQRAAVIGAAVALTVFLLCLPARRGVLTVRGGEVFLLLLALVAVVLTPIVVQAARGGHGSVPLASSASYIQGSQEKQLSSQGRLNQWRKVIPLIKNEPIFGHGLGATFEYYEPGPEEVIVSELTHNLILDMLYRTGVVGLALISLAFGASIATGWRLWRKATTEPAYATLALAISAMLVGWIAKGMAESLFEKYRLALLLGLLLGLIESLRTGAVPEPIVDGGLQVPSKTPERQPVLEQVGS